jgi:hypothetical protein
MQDSSPYHFWMTQQQFQTDGSSVAGTENPHWSHPEGLDQRSGIVGLLLEGGLSPSCRCGTARVATTVVGDDCQCIGELISNPLEVTGVSGGTADEEHRRTTATYLTIEIGAIGLHHSFLNRDRL